MESKEKSLCNIKWVAKRQVVIWVVEEVISNENLEEQHSPAKVGCLWS